MIGTIEFNQITRSCNKIKFVHSCSISNTCNPLSPYLRQIPAGVSTCHERIGTVSHKREIPRQREVSKAMFARKILDIVLAAEFPWKINAARRAKSNLSRPPRKSSKVHFPLPVRSSFRLFRISPCSFLLFLPIFFFLSDAHWLPERSSGSGCGTSRRNCLCSPVESQYGNVLWFYCRTGEGKNTDDAFFFLLAEDGRLLWVAGSGLPFGQANSDDEKFFLGRGDFNRDLARSERWYWKSLDVLFKFLKRLWTIHAQVTLQNLTRRGRGD